ncbi:hypothetical protein RJ55_04275 [Drechmeria coniospora]|nr:hypothetical protein RJ55_04275 [Drechmeria coniospora]
MIRCKRSKTGATFEEGFEPKLQEEVDAASPFEPEGAVTVANPIGEEDATSKHQRIFEKMRKDMMKGQLRVVESADDLDEFELRECYRIIDAAIKRQSSSHEISWEVYQMFLENIFINWNSQSETPLNIQAKTRFANKLSHDGSQPAGYIKNGSGLGQVFYRFDFNFEPWASFTVGLVDESGTPVGACDLCLVEPNRNFDRDREMKECLGNVQFVEMARLFQTENCQLAVLYARRMIRARTQTLELQSPGPRVPPGEYVYAGTENFFKMLRVIGGWSENFFLRHADTDSTIPSGQGAGEDE